MDKAREIIAGLVREAKEKDGNPRYAADFILTALTAAGYRIVGQGEVDAETVERLAGWHDYQALVLREYEDAVKLAGGWPDTNGRVRDMAWHVKLAAALRSLAAKSLQERET